MRFLSLALRDGALILAVATEHVDVFDRHEQLVAAVIENAQAVVRRAGDLQRDQAIIAADAVIDMDDEIALLDAGDFAQESIGATRRAAWRPRQPFAEHVLLADDHQVGQAEALLQAEHGHGRRLGRQLGDVGPGFDRLQAVDVVIAEQMGHALARALAVGDEHDAAAGFARLHDGGCQGGEDVAAHLMARGGEIDADAAPSIEAALAGWRGEWRELHHGAWHETGRPILRCEIQGVRRHRIVYFAVGLLAALARLLHVAPRFVELGDLLEPRIAGLGHTGIQRHRHAGHIVENRR